uniref:Putative dual kunitz salivary protein n=1 Tax=Ornithodoros turicata TaxID=34597 RepID=A0A2R5LP20_9ACAR
MEIAFPILFLTVACALLGALAYPKVAQGGGEVVDICQLPPVTGDFICMGYGEMFTFNFTQQKCVQYIYGLCGGTANLFGTEQECNERCPGNGTSTKRKGKGKGKKEGRGKQKQGKKEEQKE